MSDPEKELSTLQAQLTTQFLCRKEDSDPEFYQVTDVTWQLEADFYFNVTNNMTTYVMVDKFDLEPTGYYNNTINVNLFTYNKLYKDIVDGQIKKKINKPFVNGTVPIGGLLESKGLGILYLKEMEMWAEIGYLVFNITPEYRRYNKVPTISDLLKAFGPDFENFIEELESKLLQIGKSHITVNICRR